MAGIEGYSAKYHRLSEPSAGVLLLEFNRGPVNAFHDDMWLETQKIVEQVPYDPRYRVVVLTSALEKHFTAGLDLAAAQGSLVGKENKMDAAREALSLQKHIVDFQAAIGSFASCRIPVIVALYGTCLGLAIDIASACDIRLAASNASFAIAEVNVGLAADIGTLQRFPKIVGNDSKAREYALTGRRFGAQEAKEIGFVSDVFEGGRKGVLDAALALGRMIAEKSPVAVMSTKHLMNHSRDHTIQEGLTYTAAWNMSMLQSVDTAVAMKAVFTKKAAEFPSLAPVSSRAKL